MSKVIVTIVNSCNECPYLSAYDYLPGRHIWINRCTKLDKTMKNVETFSIPEWCDLEDSGDIDE
jgi:hypothetical protein